MLKNLKTLRQHAGLSQVKVAEALGVTQGAVAQWESGATVPRPDKLPELARMYDCTIEDLFTTDKTA